MKTEWCRKCGNYLGENMNHGVLCWPSQPSAKTCSSGWHVEDARCHCIDKTVVYEDFPEPVKKTGNTHLINKERKVLAVDIDDTITNGEKFWNAIVTPKIDIIEKVNALYRQGHVIIYHTARHPSEYQRTYAWLVHHNCYFHALEMGKLSATNYIDDKNTKLNDLID